MFEKLNAFVYDPFHLTLAGIALLFGVIIWILGQIGPPEKTRNPLRFSDKRLLNVLGWFALFFFPIWAALFLGNLFLLARLATVILEKLAGKPDDLRWYVLAFVGLMTTLGGILGTPLALLRVWTTERQTETAEQSHITDQINKAVENLGANKTITYLARVVHWKDENDRREGFIQKWGEDFDIKYRLPDRLRDLSEEQIDSFKSVSFGDWIENTETVPNLEVRIGGLLALERIGKQNPSEHIQIMEILCAYIRENARQFVAREVPLDDDGSPTLETPIFPRDDIASALTVIQRRGDSLREREHAETPPFRLNFYGADFRGLDLSKRDFENALMEHAKLQGANLSWAQMQGAVLSRSEMKMANLRGATMQGADLKGANMQRTRFFGTELQNALFRGAWLQEAKMYMTKLQGAKLSAAKMQGAVLFSSKLQGSDLSSAELAGAELNGVAMNATTKFFSATFEAAAIFNVDLSKVSISPEQLAQMFGDASNTLPDSLMAEADLSHWELGEVLDWDPDPDKSEFHQRWHAWQDAIGFDRPTFELKHPET